jgi:Sigma-70, region 4
MWSEGITVAEITRQVGISRERVRQIIEKADWAIGRKLRARYGDGGIMLPMPSDALRRYGRP